MPARSRRGDLPLLLVRRSGEDRREQQQRRAALLPATRIRAPSSASPAAACSPRASIRRQAAGLPEMDHRQGRPGRSCKTGTSFEYAVGVGAESNPKLVPLADLQAPKVDPSKLNSKKVTDLMTAGRPALSCPFRTVRRPIDARRGRYERNRRLGADRARQSLRGVIRAGGAVPTACRGSAAALLVSLAALLPLGFIVWVAVADRLGHRLRAGLPAPRRRAAGQHGAAGRLHRAALHRAGGRPGLADRAHRPAGRADLGLARGRAAGGAGLRPQLCLGQPWCPVCTACSAACWSRCSPISRSSICRSRHSCGGSIRRSRTSPPRSASALAGLPARRAAAVAARASAAARC